ncbi:hypothetical protein PTTG_28962 [Puccinia triticina 1-1 BBBD Race 1]|uniref:Uncharacterized protein n=1 Tax=Puccinia triticina (isolate 1-1 / race 1 (BBBD)) TaxID=630390 RepID=A0A180G7R6_PUCT1|nr:hypothetical protein PTTG_28962 [Puccinia triticina 1-1 BBBD Race 1]
MKMLKAELTAGGRTGEPWPFTGPRGVLRGLMPGRDQDINFDSPFCGCIFPLVQLLAACKLQENHTGPSSRAVPAERHSLALLQASSNLPPFDQEAFLADIPETEWTEALEFYHVTANRCWNCGDSSHYLRDSWCTHHWGFPLASNHFPWLLSNSNLVLSSNRISTFSKDTNPTPPFPRSTSRWLNDRTIDWPTVIDPDHSKLPANLSLNQDQGQTNNGGVGLRRRKRKWQVSLMASLREILRH